MNRDWVDYLNLAFNGLGVIVAGTGLAIAIFSFVIARRAEGKAKETAAREAKTRGLLNTLLEELIRERDAPRNLTVGEMSPNIQIPPSRKPDRNYTGPTEYSHAGPVDWSSDALQDILNESKRGRE